MVIDLKRDTRNCYGRFGIAFLGKIVHKRDMGQVQVLAIRSLLTVALGSSLLLSSVQAQVQSVTSRAALGVSDSLDWGSVGAPFSTIGGAFDARLLGGLQLVVSQPSAGFELYRQNPAELQSSDQNTGWAGSFAPGDAVLYTAAPGEGPITIRFKAPVQGVGAQVESGQYGAYTGKIEAFDFSGLSLGSYSMAGVSDSRADNSAVFVGLMSSSANISRVEFSVTTDRTGDLAMNQLSVVSEPIVSIVPEPGTVALFTVGGLVVAAAGFRRRYLGL